MAAIAVVVADLLARPRPVVCFDTCDLLDIIQCVAEGKARRLALIRWLLDRLTLRPDKVKFLVSYLVPLEWEQRKATVLAEVETRTRKIDEGIAEIHLAWQHAGFPLPSPLLTYATGGLPTALASMAERLLGWATVLDKDEACVGRALDRVYEKRRPSHSGMVKDSIHLEHYLELSRQLHASGYTQRRVFVSANKADFCVAKDKADIHPDLAWELSAVGLEYYSALEAALGLLEL